MRGFRLRFLVCDLAGPLRVPAPSGRNHKRMQGTRPFALLFLIDISFLERSMTRTPPTATASPVDGEVHAIGPSISPAPKFAALRMLSSMLST